MKKIFVAIILMLVFVAFTLMLFTGCRTTKVTSSSKSDSTIYIEKIKLVPVITPPDSTWYWAWFKCDSTGHVIMAANNETKTNGVETETSFNDGKFNYKTKTVHDTVYVPVKETTQINKSKQNDTITVTIIKMNLFEKIFFWIGLGGCVVFLIWVGFKFKGLIGL